jgi:hypothetical protein
MSSTSARMQPRISGGTEFLSMMPPARKRLISIAASFARISAAVSSR